MWNDRDSDLDEEQDPRKVLDEEFEFLAKNWHLYLIATFLSFAAVAAVVASFLLIMHLLVGNY